MIPAERAHLHVVARSHPGMSGKNNEDRYAVSAYYLDETRAVPSLLAVVSDGIGGHRAGEVAAEIAVETISQFVAASDGSQPTDTLEEAIVAASQEIFEQSEQEDDQRGMGATCACAWIIGDQLYTANVGDSRIYLLRGDSIQQISVDHTWIQEAIDLGAITREEARTHPNAHVIRRYLGSRQPVEPDLRLRLNPSESDRQSEANQGLTLLPGDGLFLCSDGLTDLVEDTEILAALKSEQQAAALDQLVDLANQRGGHDNITIVSVNVPVTGYPPPAPAAAPPKQEQTSSASFLQPACLGIAGAAILAVLLVIGGVWWFLLRPIGAPAGSATETRGVFPTFTPESGGVLASQTPALFTLTPLPDLTLTAGAPGPGTALAPTSTTGAVISSAIPAPSSTPGGAETAVSPPTLTPWPTNTQPP